MSMGMKTLALVIVMMSSTAFADASIEAPPRPSLAQATAAARRLWKAVRARDRNAIAAAVDKQVRMWASLAELAVDDNYQAEVDRASFAARMLTLELGDEPATDWHAVVKPPLKGSADMAWVGAAVQARTGSEGHGARTGDLSFGVRFRDGRALVVAFDVVYGESHRIFSK
jgi:hypothetical protein